MVNIPALEGGTPVRTTPLAPHFIGANLIGSEEKKFVNEAIENQSLFRHYGKCEPHFAADFEDEFAAYIGKKYALATATGSGAYFCMMKALGIGADDEVIIPAFGWVTDYNMVEMLGAVPVLAEIDESMNLSPEGFKACITEKTKAVVVIHYQGGASRLDEIVEIARANDIIVIEDVAQACGGSFKGKKLGAWGDVACYSLQNNKVITAGEGGVMVTDDQKIYELAVRYHDLGFIRPQFEKRLEKPVITEPVCGLQWRMNEMTGAVALAQLHQLDGIVANCKEKSALFRDAIKKEFPELKFRSVDPTNDIGIAVIFDLGSSENVAKFNKYYEAEGLISRATSGCQSFSMLEPTAFALKKRNYWPEALTNAELIDSRTAKIAVLPVYTNDDIEDLALGAIKSLKAVLNK